MPRALSIDPQAMIIADEDREEEKRLVQDIGSTGQGVGAATSRRIMQCHDGSREARPRYSGFAAVHQGHAGGV